ncbi:hypothetical protein PENTCL1PPCAC_13341, partial [Pristionchus entomophagus]
GRAGLVLARITDLIAKDVEDGFVDFVRNRSSDQLLLDDISDSHIGGLVRVITRPHGDLAALGAHICHETADLVHILSELLANDGNENLQPDGVHHLIRATL